MIAAARASLAAALHDSLPHCTVTEAEGIAEAVIWRWERDGWFAVPERPPAARTAPRRTLAASEATTAATQAA